MLASTSKSTANQPTESEDRVPESKQEGQGKKAPKCIQPVPVSSGDRKHQIAKKSRISQMAYPDRVNLADATPLYPTTSIKLCWTGVTPEMFTTDSRKVVPRYPYIGVSSTFQARPHRNVTI